jgi:hypothetical protein
MPLPHWAETAARPKQPRNRNNFAPHKRAHFLAARGRKDGLRHCEQPLLKYRHLLQPRGRARAPFPAAAGRARMAPFPAAARMAFPDRRCSSLAAAGVFVAAAGLPKMPLFPVMRRLQVTLFKMPWVTPASRIIRSTAVGSPSAVVTEVLAPPPWLMASGGGGNAK